MQLNIPLNSSLSIPLQRQIYQSLRDSILAGRLNPGDRLPSTRAMSEALGVSRMTVTLSYEQLLSEGYLETAFRSGTYVSRSLSHELLPVETTTTQDTEFRLSYYGHRLQEAVPFSAPVHATKVNFHHGKPDYSYFPHAVWRKLLMKHCRRADDSLLDYAAHSQGYRPLREVIATYLSRARRVRCTAEQVLIVNGSQQALDLIARVLTNVRDVVALEDPCYNGARRTFEIQGARILPVPVDEGGVDVEQLKSSRVKNIRLIHVTPSHQFPSGFVLSLERRLDLLDWAINSGAIIIEDDYDSEYRYTGYPLPSLQGLSPQARVIYIGTFSRVLFPSLRIGYVVAPKNLIETLTRAKWLADRQSPMLEQFALTDFIRDGHLERHIRRMRKLYDHRRQLLVSSLRQHLGSRVTIQGDNAGMHILIRFHVQLSADALTDLAAKHGVGILQARRCFIRRPYRNEFLLGYANLNDVQICEGVERLAQAINNL